MGYDMHSRNVPKGEKETKYFRANIWGMQELRSIMTSAGVPNVVELRKASYDEKKQTFGYKKQGTLMTCFGSNDGWWVTPADCQAISDKLHAWLDKPGAKIWYEFVPFFFSKNKAWKKRMDRLTVALAKLQAVKKPSRLVKAKLQTIHHRFAKQMYKRTKKVLTDDNLSFVKEFADYCQACTKLNGFFVW